MIAGWQGAAFAALPVGVVLLLMGLLQVRGHWATLAGAFAAAAVALTVGRAAPLLVLSEAAAGALRGLFPVVYIMAAVLLLYNLTVATGHAARLRSAVELITSERSLHLVMIGFAFAAFLDATAGFLTPVVVGAAMLVDLGFEREQAARYTLVGAAIPAVFGAMGIPVLVLADVTHLPFRDLVQGLAIAAGATMFLMPPLLVCTFSGWTEFRRLWRPVLACGLGYALALIGSAFLFGYSVAAVLAALGALAGLAWAAPAPVGRRDRLSWGALLEPWLPYGLLAIMVSVWSLLPVDEIAGPYLASPGTAILVATLLFGLRARAPLAAWRGAVTSTGRQLQVSAVSICAAFAMAGIMHRTGMTEALGLRLGMAGPLYPVLSPLLSWFTAAVMGSNTAANIVVGGLQAETAAQLGLSPVVVIAITGVAAAGKMAAPQVVTAVAGAAGLAGHEGRLLRTGLAYSLAIALLLGITVRIVA